MGPCAECGKYVEFQWVRPDALQKKIENVADSDLVCLACYLDLYWPEEARA